MARKANKQKETSRNWKNNKSTDISNEKLSGLHMRKSGYGFEKDTVFLLIQAKNDAIMTNYVKEKIDNAQQNSKCTSCRKKKDKTIKHTVSKCRKVAQKDQWLCTIG